MNRWPWRRWAAPWLALVSLAAQAQWQFGAPMDVAVGGPGVFHHLDASGRRALAVSAGLWALAWEDNRDGQPRCHLALGKDDGTPLQTFGYGQGECFEPAVTALEDGRFALVWEDETGVNAALANAAGVGPALNLAPSGGHGTLAYHPSLGLYAAWSGTEGPRRRIWRTRLDSAEHKLKLADASQPADPWPPVDDQLYPVLAAGVQGLTLAWEDRRRGHTVIYYSHGDDGRVWSMAARLSRNPTGRVNGQLGRGTGAMRPALTAFGDGRLAAVWLDKRDFLSGYDVYAALSDNGGVTFGPDRKAQDSFGDSIAQWHAAAAGDGAGRLAIAWDDDRDGTSDIWLTWLKSDGGFADNSSPVGGPGAQTDPVMAVDEQGGLHLAWIERVDEQQSRLRYLAGRLTQ